MTDLAHLSSGVRKGLHSRHIQIKLPLYWKCFYLKCSFGLECSHMCHFFLHIKQGALIFSFMKNITTHFNNPSTKLLKLNQPPGLYIVWLLTHAVILKSACDFIWMGWGTDLLKFLVTRGIKERLISTITVICLKTKQMSSPKQSYNVISWKNTTPFFVQTPFNFTSPRQNHIS